MKLRSVSALLFTSLTFIATNNGALAQTADPAEVERAMIQGNINIDNDVKVLKIRCNNQARRKETLDKEILQRKPELASLATSKTTLTTQLKQKDDTLQTRSRSLATLRASISDLQDAIRNANTSTATRLVTLRAEREAARRAAAAASRDIDSTDAVFEKWKNQGSNEFTLYRAQLKDENNKILPPEKRTPLTADEQKALDYLKSYDTMRAGYVTTKTTNEAIVAEKDRTIASLISGTRENVQTLRGRLREKEGMVGAAVAAVASAQSDFNGTQGELRRVNARIATLSDINIPAIPTVCSLINQVPAPRT